MEEDESEQEIIKGVLHRIRFSNDEGTWAVAELHAPERVLPVTMVGNLLATQPGETVEALGEWIEDARFGRQFKLAHIKSVPPVTKEGIERYLSSGFIDGIGGVLAKRIVEKFGANTLDILDANPERLGEVAGIGKKRLNNLVGAWSEQRAIRTVMVFLQSNGISPTYAVKIFDLYGDRAVDIVQTNPYKLAEDIFGIGFRKADEIARAAGLEHDALERLKAGVQYALRQAAGLGHVFLPVDELREKAVELLGGVPADMVGEAIEVLRHEEQIVLEPILGAPAAVYRYAAWKQETAAARHLLRLAQSQMLLGNPALGAMISEIEQEMGVRLAPAQREAIEAAWKHKVVVITGGPGTGKTTIVRAVTRIGQLLNQKMELGAPTGRAAKRLAEATGLGAQTLHRLFEFSFQAGGFQVNEEAPMDVDMMIVDEASMLDTYLLGALTRALPDQARLLLVGDIDQLPSVGPGNVLGDVIASEVVHVVRLTEIFRQAEQSSIVRNAHRINRGQMPEVPERRGKELVDFYAIEVEEPLQAQAKILEMVTGRIPKAFGYDPLQDVQILSPMHKGAVGCAALNQLLQERMNPGAEELIRGARRYKVGDKVMQIRNNYEHEVFNGDIGRIAEIDHEDKFVIVRFDDRAIPYDFSNLDELQLAYAITVHKSQGSEYPAVVIPMVTQHFIMLQRNLLYTAITRAKELVILVGTQKAVGIAVRQNESQRRYTRLAHRLREGDLGPPEPRW